MNYFEFYELPLRFELDTAALQQRFYANSKKYHPDFYTLTDAAKQAEILELSTLNNEAYQTLRDPDRRMAYLLRLQGALGDEGQNKIPQDFLMEVMDLNETLMELEFDYDAAAYERVRGEVAALEEALWRAIAPRVVAYRGEAGQAADLEAIKNYYLKKRYLLRIRENLNKFAAR
ncbi:MAG: Fe-S protein assembly co-chaperone HscB [Bacteroidota bacterium]